MTKSNKLLRTIFTSFIVFLFLPISFVCGYIYESLSREKRISGYITSLAQERTYGNAVFASIETKFLNYDVIEEEQEKFNEKLNNKLAYTVSDCSMSLLETVTISDVTLMECYPVDRYYNDLHIYTPNNWYQTSESGKSIIVPQTLLTQIANSNGISSIDELVGEEIQLRNNNIVQTTTIAGYYMNQIGSSITGYIARGKQMNDMFGNLIFASTSFVKSFNPTKLTAMFSSDSSNNGKKYVSLEKFANNNNLTIEFDFADDPEQLNSFTQLINENKTLRNNIYAILITICFLITLYVINTILVDKYKMIKSASIKKKIIFESIFFFNLFAVPIGTVYFLKNKYWSLWQTKLRLINESSLIILTFSIIITFVIFIKHNKALSQKLLKFNNNFELDVDTHNAKGTSLFLGNFYTDKFLKELPNNIRLQMDNTNYEKSFINIIENNYNSIDAVTYPAYDASHKFVMPEIKEIDKNINFTSISIRNNKWFYVLSRKRAIKEYLFELSKKKQYETIYLSTYHYASLIGYVKSLFPHSKMVLLLPNLPLFNINSVTFKYKLLMSYNQLTLKRNLKYIDLLLPITEYQADYLKFDSEKTFVYEGRFESKTKVNEDKTNTIIYVGGTSYSYGVDDLVNSFIKCKSSSKYKLILCGNDNYFTELKSIIANNKKITCLESIGDDEVFRLEAKAKLIIFPDKAKRPFSFNQKFLEALASGTPVLCYKPFGAKEEYLQYLNFISDDMAKDIDDCLKDIDGSKSLKAKEASRFVAKEKNAKSFAKKLKQKI